MISPRQDGPFFDDRYERDDGYQAAYQTLEKMNPRPAGPMPASRHRQARIAVTCGGMTRRRQKKVLQPSVAIANS